MAGSSGTPCGPRIAWIQQPSRREGEIATGSQNLATSESDRASRTRRSERLRRTSRTWVRRTPSSSSAASGLGIKMGGLGKQPG